MDDKVGWNEEGLSMSEYYSPILTKYRRLRSEVRRRLADIFVELGNYMSGGTKN